MLLTRRGSAGVLLLLDVLLPLGPVQAQTAAGKGNLLPPVTGSQEWALTVAPPAKATLARQARAVVVTVTAPGDQPWQAQVSHQGVDLANGQAYTLRFRAKADAPRDMVVFGGINRPDYHDVGLSQTVALSADWKDYALTFTAHDVIPGQVSIPEFRVGRQNGRVWLAGVTLIPSGHVAPVVRAAAPPSGMADAVSPGLRPPAGETLLEGTVREMRPAQRQFVLLVTRVFVHGGGPRDVEPPRQQVIAARPSMGLERLPAKTPSHKNPFAALQPGDRIAVIGRVPSASGPLAARLVVIAARGTTPASAPDAP